MTATTIDIPIGDRISLKGDLSVPDTSHSLVIFSHGSGSSRLSTRNRYVAEVLNKEKIATLLVDLLTVEEDQVYENRFNIDLLTDRLKQVTSYANRLPGLQNLRIGYFGASTGAASALNAAAELKDLIHAVVSRGGRPDLAAKMLMKVNAPTLLIIGSLDTEVIKLNTQALNLLNCEKRIEIVEGAAHLFEEPGKLAEVARLAGGWFNKYLSQQTETVTSNNAKK